MTFSPPAQPPAYCAPRGVQIHPLGRTYGGQHLLLLGAELAGLERGRLLHGGQCEQLQQVVLDHVPRDADPVEVSGPTADSDVLRHGDLDVIDVVVVPHRLEQLIGEPQRHHVLHGFLAQIVIDAEHRARREHAGDDPVQLLRAGQVVAERLLDHHPAPATGLLLGQAVRPQLIDDGLEQARRDGQIEGVIAAGAARLVEIHDGLGQVGERLVVTDLARHEADAFRQLLPDLFAERRPGVLLDRRVHDLGEVLVLPVTPGEAHQGEAGRQQAAVGQIVDGRHQLLRRQVTGDAEDHQHAGTGDPRESPILRIA